MLCFYPESGWLSSPRLAEVNVALRGTPFGSELPAAPSMLVAEHGSVAHSPTGWQIAVVLRYFVAVLMEGEWV